MDNMFVWFNNNLGGPIGSIIAAILVFVSGWLVALGIAGLVRGLLARMNVNQRMNTSTGKNYDIEGIVSKVVFWFIFLMAISGALSMISLNAISVPFGNMIDKVLAFIPTLLGAAIIGAIGWVIATVARTGVDMALSKTTLDERLTAHAGVRPMSSTIADMVYWVILLFTIVIVLGQLELDGLFAPLTNMVDKFLNAIPNIIAAAIIFFIGYIVAKVVRGIATSFVSTLDLQGYADRAGITGERHNSLPNLAGSLAFLLVIIPTIVAALDALNIDTITRPAVNMLNEIIGAIPNIITAAAILIITYMIMKMVANVVRGLLANTSVNALPAKVGLQEAMGTMTVSDLVAKALIFFAMLFAGIMAADVLGFEQISGIITMFIAFGADILLGAVILFIGFWLANIIAGIVERSEQGSQFLANIVRVLIMGLVLAMGLKAMGIADSIVNLAFGLTLGAVAVAFALSFGLGGQEAAARLLRKMQDKMDEERTGLKVDTTRNTKMTSEPRGDTAVMADADTKVSSTVTSTTTSNTTPPSSTFDSDDLN